MGGGVGRLAIHARGVVSVAVGHVAVHAGVGIPGHADRTGATGIRHKAACKRVLVLLHQRLRLAPGSGTEVEN